MLYTRLRVPCLTAEIDTVAAILGMVDNYLQIEDTSDIEETIVPQYGELIDDSILNSDRTRGAVSIYILPEAAPEAEGFIRRRLAESGLQCEIESSQIDPAEWENEWKKYYVPVHIGRRLVVVPRWVEYTPAAGEVIVRMDPGMAFGSGTHETTRLCACLIEKYITTADTVLDIGTGSGILAIFASKLGAASVFGCDIDPIAVRVAKDNAAENDVTSVSFGASDLLSGVPKRQYSLVVANIVADIIVRLAPDLPERMTSGGRAVFSGIIAEREGEVRSAMERAGLRFIEAAHENDWSALVFEK